MSSHSWPPHYDGIVNGSDSGRAFFQLPYLWRPDCVSRSLSHSDTACTDECANPTALFSDSTYSLWHCALYPNVTADLRAGLLPEENVSYLITNHVDTSLAKAANMTSMVSTCLDAYCEMHPMCKGANPRVCSATAMNINGTMLSTDALDACVQTLCTNNQVMPANTDIAGIGILSSYIMQATIVLLGALVLALLNAIGYGSGNTHSYIPVPEAAGSKAAGVQHHQNEQEAEQNIHRLDKLYAAMLLALNELFKAQCFVGIALSVAALTALNAVSGYTQVDQIALGTAGGAGTVPVAFNLYAIATFNPTRRSWYTYGLALCTWVTAYSTILGHKLAQLNRQSKDPNEYLIDPQYPNTCGNTALYSICNEWNRPNIHPEYTYYYTLCIPVMLGLSVWQFCSISYIEIRLAPLRIQAFRNHVSLCNTLIHVSALGLLAAPFYFWLKAISDLFSNQVVDDSWKFGQIIAITVWIPTIVGFVNDYVDGIRDARTKQLPMGYRMVVIEKK